MLLSLDLQAAGGAHCAHTMSVGVPERSQSVDDAIAGLFPDAAVFEDMRVGFLHGAGDVAHGAGEPVRATEGVQHRVQERVQDSRMHLAHTHHVQSTGGNVDVHTGRSVVPSCNAAAASPPVVGTLLSVVQLLPVNGPSPYAQFNCNAMAGHTPAGVACPGMVLQPNHGGATPTDYKGFVIESKPSRQETTSHGSGMAKGGDGTGTFSRTTTGYSAVLGAGVAQGCDGTFSRTASGYSAVLGAGTAHGGEGTFSRTASGYSAVLSGETGTGMPISRTASGHMVNPVPTAMLPASSVFVRTPSGGFARAPSGSFARASSGANISRTSSTAASHTSEWTDGGEDADMEGGVPAGGSRGDNRMRAKQAPKRRPWSADEHARFVESLKRFGSRDKAESGGRVTVGLGPGVAEIVAVVVGTRTVSQVRSHAQKYFLQLSRLASSGSNSGQAASTSSSMPATTSQSTKNEPAASAGAQGANKAQARHAHTTSSPSSSIIAHSSPAANYMPGAAAAGGGGKANGSTNPGPPQSV